MNKSEREEFLKVWSYIYALEDRLEDLETEKRPEKYNKISKLLDADPD